MSFDGYVRVSRVRGREGESFISPAVQRERIAAHLTAHGHALGEVFEDLDLPGSHSERPGLKQAIARIESGESAGIVVAKLDRFGRSTIDIARNLERIEKAGGVLLTAAEGIDTSNPFGRFLVSIMGALAQLELERITETWQTSRERAVERGVHIASRTPTGYVRRRDGRLEPGPAAPAVARLFRAAAKGATWGELAALLDGTPTPYGATRWTGRSLAHVLRNRVYLGEARSGEFTLPGAHEPIIDLQTWTAAQRPAGTRAARGRSLLAGIVRCAGCRYVMRPDSMTHRGRRVRTYRCRGTRPHGDCEARAAVLGSVVEPFVIKSVFARIGDLRMQGMAASQELAASRRALGEATAERDAYRDSASVSIIGPSAFSAGLAKRQEPVDRLTAEVARLERRAGLSEVLEVVDLRSAWDQMELADQRALLSRLIDAVFVRSVGRRNVAIAERALILWNGEAPDLPGPGKRLSPIVAFEW